MEKMGVMLLVCVSISMSFMFYFTMQAGRRSTAVEPVVGIQPVVGIVHPEWRSTAKIRENEDAFSWACSLAQSVPVGDYLTTTHPSP
jgi:hypothetical protein